MVREIDWIEVIRDTGYNTAHELLNDQHWKEKRTVTEIAKILGLTTITVSRKMNKLCIPVRIRGNGPKATVREVVEKECSIPECKNKRRDNGRFTLWCSRHKTLYDQGRLVDYEHCDNDYAVASY